MHGYWLAVAGNLELQSTDLTETYWCLPISAARGDRILFYCPRAVSFGRHGLFAEGVIAVAPSLDNPENRFCRQFGLRDHLGPLRHVTVTIRRRFKPYVTTKEMKGDPVLSKEKFVRRNFQGTAFLVGRQIYERLVGLAEARVMAGEVPKEKRKRRSRRGQTTAN